MQDNQQLLNSGISVHSGFGHPGLASLAMCLQSKVISSNQIDQPAPQDLNSGHGRKSIDAGNTTVLLIEEIGSGHCTWVASSETDGLTRTC